MNQVDVLIVTSGDELWGVERVRLALSNAGFSVLGVGSAEAKSAILTVHPALIIANLSGDRQTDTALCEKLSQLSAAPLIVMGPALDEATIVELFETVVDDYLPRPLNPREVVARVRSLLRRSQPDRFERPSPAPLGLPAPVRRSRSSFVEWIRTVIHRPAH